MLLNAKSAGTVVNLKAIGGVGGVGWRWREREAELEMVAAMHAHNPLCDSQDGEAL